MLVLGGDPSFCKIAEFGDLAVFGAPDETSGVKGRVKGNRTISEPRMPAKRG
jgi:hypothetical protein